ncbi:MAG: helix-turn-helix domain-containing protein [bacterium]
MSALKALREKERETRRELILSAAQQLFSDKDFRQVTVREIAKTAQVSPGTIYRYYRNMDDLFVDIFLNHVSCISSLIDEEFGRHAQCSVLRFCEIQVAYLNENMTFYQMMSHFMLGRRLPSENAARIDPIMRDLFDRLEQILRLAGLVTDSRFKAHALFAAINGTMISYARYPGRSPEETRQHTMRLARIIADQFSSGQSVS